LAICENEKVKMATVINSDHSSIQAIAEVILGRLEPK
jgi:hypothetical protein